MKYKAKLMELSRLNLLNCIDSQASAIIYPIIFVNMMKTWHVTWQYSLQNSPMSKKLTLIDSRTQVNQESRLNLTAHAIFTQYTNEIKIRPYNRNLIRKL